MTLSKDPYSKCPNFQWTQLYDYTKRYIVYSNSIDIKIEELYYTQNVQGINLYDISM